MTALNFDETNDTDDSEATIRALAREDFDDYEDILALDEALERRGITPTVQRAIDDLGEEEAAIIYDETLDDMQEDPCTSSSY